MVFRTLIMNRLRKLNGLKKKIGVFERIKSCDMIDRFEAITIKSSLLFTLKPFENLMILLENKIVY